MTIVYIAGAMRSGTTMIGQMLAGSEGLMFVGEVRPIVMTPQGYTSCDCGKPRSACPFWSKVDAETGLPDVQGTLRSAYQLKTLPRIAWSVLTRAPLPREVAEVVAVLRAIASAAGDRGVIDGSKTPTGVVLWRLAGYRPHVVHCVRDPREVAAAQARPTSESGLPQEPKWRSYAVWLAYNLFVLMSRPLAASYTFAGFARLKVAPARILTKVWGKAGVAAARTGDSAQFAISQSHVLAGNPRRERGGTLRLRA